jgi:hypothetical protein
MNVINDRILAPTVLVFYYQDSDASIHSVWTRCAVCWIKLVCVLPNLICFHFWDAAESLAICQYLLLAVVLIRFSHYGPHQSELGMDVLSKQLAFVRSVGLDFCSTILSF